MEILKKYMKDVYDLTLDDDATVGDFVDSYINENQSDGRGLVSVVYPQRLDLVNLEITQYCNLNCHSCDQFIDSAPTRHKKIMTVDQVKDFIEESQRLNWNWVELRLTGGEPSLHPDFLEIMRLLNEGLKEKYLPNLVLKIISNSTGKKVRSVFDFDNANVFHINRATEGFYLDHIGHPNWLVVSSKPLKDTVEHIFIKNHEGIDEKAELIPQFGNVWQAPIDRIDEIQNMYDGDYGEINNPPVDGFIPPKLTKDQVEDITTSVKILDCQLHATCGLLLTRAGYVPCPGGGSRAIGNPEMYFSRLSDINEESCKEKLKKLCLTCGQNMMYSVECSKRLGKTKFWELILKQYQESEPELELYDPFDRRTSKE